MCTRNGLLTSATHKIDVPTLPIPTCSIGGEVMFLFQSSINSHTSWWVSCSTATMPLPVTLPQDEEDNGDGDQATPSPPNSRPKKKFQNSQDWSPLATTVKKKTTKVSNISAPRKQKASTVIQNCSELCIEFKSHIRWQIGIVSMLHWVYVCFRVEDVLQDD